MCIPQTTAPETVSFADRRFFTNKYVRRGEATQLNLNQNSELCY